VEQAGTLAERRAGQARAWLWSELRESLVTTLKTHPGVAARLPTVEADVMAGKVTPTAAARGLLDAFLGRKEG
jgi:LAO/AO transport system kinase